jgi:hypothetical protein
MFKFSYDILGYLHFYKLKIRCFSRFFSFFLIRTFKMPDGTDGLVIFLKIVNRCLYLNSPAMSPIDPNGKQRIICFRKK